MLAVKPIKRRPPVAAVDANVLSAISQTLYRFALGMDEDDIDMLAGCFTDDGVVTIGSGDRVEGREAIRAHFAQRRVRRRANGQLPRHVVTNTVMVEGDSREAKVVSYIVGVMTEATRTIVSAGRYNDHFVRESDQWLIKERQIKIDEHGADVSAAATSPETA
jgi:uncharacterized protein (TIGR02246 family)